MMDRYFSIQWTHESASTQPLHSTPRVASGALRSIGLTENVKDGEPYRRVTVKTPLDDWGVDVPADRAEEYARELWKNLLTEGVSIAHPADLYPTDFPKPASEAVSELEAYKKLVLEVALQAKQENDWCDEGFEEAMEKLGIKTPKKKVRVVLELDANHPQLSSGSVEAVQYWIKDGAGRYSEIASAVVYTELIEE